MNGNLNDNGWYLWEPGFPIAMVVFVKHGGFVEGTQIETLYHPTEDEITKVCGIFGIPSKKLIEIVFRNNNKANTLFVDVNKFLEGLKGSNE